MPRPLWNLLERPERLLAPCVCALLLTACGGAGVTGASKSGGDVTATYAAAFVSGSQSGTLTITTHSAGQATGTLAAVSGVTTALSGSYSPANGSFTLSGGGYSFTGSTSASSASGLFTGPSASSGGFSGLTQAAGATAASFCGSWQVGAGFGWLNAVAIGNALTVVAGGPFVGTVSLTGAVSGSTFTASSAGGSSLTTANGSIVSTDSISGTYVNGSGTGTLAASKGACTSAGSTNSLSGEWATNIGAGTTINVALLQVGTTLSGSGVITVQPGVPSPAGGPDWTGDGYTITSGNVSAANVTFTSTLVGNNPRKAGGAYHGTLTFTGTVSGAATMTGTLTYTPTFTDSQTFPQGTATVTLTRQQ